MEGGTAELLFSQVSPNSSSVAAGPTILLQQQKLVEALQQMVLIILINSMCPQSYHQNRGGGAQNGDLHQHQLQKSFSEYF